MAPGLADETVQINGASCLTKLRMENLNRIDEINGESEAIRAFEASPSKSSFFFIHSLLNDVQDKVAPYITVLLSSMYLIKLE